MEAVIVLQVLRKLRQLAQAASPSLPSAPYAMEGFFAGRLPAAPSSLVSLRTFAAAPAAGGRDAPPRPRHARGAAASAPAAAQRAVHSSSYQHQHRAWQALHAGAPRASGRPAAAAAVLAGASPNARRDLATAAAEVARAQQDVDCVAVGSLLEFKRDGGYMLGRALRTAPAHATWEVEAAR
jgi:hypothetical protein